ncbi:molybdopterin-binding protein [Roseococcus sp. DSY-14]|uniref:TOBE domain-containing protein n=1 Tax=Roseococcus sp. DSY-14 TaxID=3369650 RepID=UPI00387A8CD6
MKLSARNQFAGTVTAIRKGVTTTHVQVEVAPGVVFTAAITNESAEELGLAVGKPAVAVVKASDVMVGVAG